jgi:Zn ribbon nucleic-acid-binding protein
VRRRSRGLDGVRDTGTVLTWGDMYIYILRLCSHMAEIKYSKNVRLGDICPQCEESLLSLRLYGFTGETWRECGWCGYREKVVTVKRAAKGAN